VVPFYSQLSALCNKHQTNIKELNIIAQKYVLFCFDALQSSVPTKLGSTCAPNMNANSAAELGRYLSGCNFSKYFIHVTPYALISIEPSLPISLHILGMEVY
jgi:hypothetical protein